VVLRRSTERPEALGPTCRLLSDPRDLPAVARGTATTPRWASPRATPFGNGHAATRTADMITTVLGTATAPITDHLEPARSPHS